MPLHTISSPLGLSKLALSEELFGWSGCVAAEEPAMSEWLVCSEPELSVFKEGEDDVLEADSCPEL